MKNFGLRIANCEFVALCALLFALCLARPASAAEPSKEQILQAELAQARVKILRLEKTLAAMVMEDLQRRYGDARAKWKEKLKALGEPDPDVVEAKEQK